MKIYDTGTAGPRDGHMIGEQPRDYSKVNDKLDQFLKREFYMHRSKVHPGSRNGILYNSSNLSLLIPNRHRPFLTPPYPFPRRSQDYPYSSATYHLH